MLKPKTPQASFLGNWVYDRIVPQDHLLRKINAVVDFSFVTDLVRDNYTPDFGRPAEDPEFMLRLCLLQYIYDDSDRQVEENARINLAYKYFLGMAVDEEPPDHSTLSTFRTQRLGEANVRKVFEHIVRQCIEKGLVTGKRQIIDSTHIEGDIAKNSLAGILKISRQNVIRDIRKQNRKLADRLAENEKPPQKQDRFTPVDQGLDDEVERATKLLDTVTHELEKGNLEATPELARSLEVLEKVVADREDGAKDRIVSPTDPDARSGKKNGKSWTGYKGHVVIEEDTEIITAVDTTPANKADGNQLKPLLKQQEEAHSLTPDEISADKAYDSAENLEMLDGKGIQGNISLTKKANHVNPEFFTVDDFTYDSETNTLTCPNGCTSHYSRRSVFRGKNAERKGTVFQFHPDQCNACELKHRCHKSKRGRSVYISYYHYLFMEMKERMASEAGKEAYRNRYRVEHKVADLARYCGMRRSRYRGIEKAGLHTLIAATVSNIKKMAKLLWQPPPEYAVTV